MSGQDQKIEHFKQFLNVSHQKNEFAAFLRANQKSLLSAKLNNLGNLQETDYQKLIPLWESWGAGSGRASASIPSAPSPVRLPGTTPAASSPSFVDPSKRIQQLSSWLYQQKTKGRIPHTDSTSIEIFVKNNYRGQYDAETLKEAIEENFSLKGLSKDQKDLETLWKTRREENAIRAYRKLSIEKYSSLGQIERQKGQKISEEEKEYKGKENFPGSIPFVNIAPTEKRREERAGEKHVTPTWKKRSYFADPGGVLLPFWIEHTFPEDERFPDKNRIRAGGKPLRDLPDSYVIKYLVNKEFRDPHLNAAIADYVASQGPAFAAKMTHAYEDRGGLSPADSDKYRSDYRPGSSSAWAKFDREERGFAVSDRDPTADDYRAGRGSYYKFRRGEQRYPKTYDPEGWFSRDVAELNKMVFGYANAVQFDSVTGRYIAQYKSVNKGAGDPRRMGEWSTVRDPASAGGNLRQTFTPKEGIDREMMEGGLMIEHRPMSMKFKGRFRAATNAIFGPGFYEEVFNPNQGKIPWNPEKTKTNPISGEDVMGDAKSYRPKYMYLQKLLRGIRNEEWGKSTEYEDTIQSMQEVIWSERFNRDEKRLMGNREEMEPAYLVEQGGVAARGNHPDVREESRTPGNEWIVDQGAGSRGKLMGDPSVQQPVQEDWVLSLESIQKAGSHRELDHYVGLIEQTYGSIREVQPLLEAASQRRSLITVAGKAP